MRGIETLFRCLAQLAILVVLVLSVAGVSAGQTLPPEPIVICTDCWQEPGPAPQPTGTPRIIPTPSPRPGSDSPTFTGTVSRLLGAAEQLIPILQTSLETPLSSWLIRLSWIVASFVLLLSFLRLMREEDGVTLHFYWWCLRAITFFIVLGLSTTLITEAAGLGYYLSKPVRPLALSARNTFDLNYAKFAYGYFTVKDNQRLWVQPLSNGEPGLVGILNSKETSLKDIGRQLDITSWDMPKLFAILTLARALLEFADLFLILGGVFLVIALRLAAPLMVAFGFDHKLAQQITYPYFWGAAGFTLVFPLVRDCASAIAYLIGNIALQHLDNYAIYHLDARTGQIITAPGSEPVLAIALAALLMLVASLTMFLTPFLAYRFLRGQVFEAVHGTTAGWMASITGSALELYGLAAGAALHKQAELTQNQAGYQADVTRAKATLEASNLSARARQVAAVSGVQGGLQTTLAAIAGGARTAQGLAVAGAQFSLASIRAQQADNTRQLLARTDQATTQTGITQRAEAVRVAGDASARKTEIWGQTATAVPYVGTVIQGGYNNTALGTRNRAQNQANNQTATESVSNQWQTTETMQQSQLQLRAGMEAATGQQLQGNLTAIRAGAGESQAGAQRGAQMAIGGLNEAYRLEGQANRTMYTGTAQASGVTRAAGEQAAHLRAWGQVIGGLFRDLDRRIEEMKPRY